MKLFFLISLLTFSLFISAQSKQNASLTVKVLNENNEQITAHIEVIDGETKQSVKQFESNNSKESHISLAIGNSYLLFFTKPGYLFQSINLTIPDSVGYEKKLNDVVMKKIDIEKTTILRNISFDFYQTLQLEESLPDINHVIQLMKDMPTLEVEISGYTDNIGSTNFNKQLSEQRAKSVVDVLISKGIDMPHLKYKGYGPSQPIASNFTEEGRLQNNRIELKIIKLDLAPLTAKELRKLKEEMANSKNENTNVPENDGNNDDDTVKVTENLDTLVHASNQDSLLRINYKGKFIADKAPLANSTVNLITTSGEIFKTTKTDQNGAFEFLNVRADQEVKIGLNAKETKKFKKIFLADTAGTVVQELNKVNGEFVLELLPSEKKKLGTVYLVDPPLKVLKKQLQNQNALILAKVMDDKGNPIKAEIDVVDNTTSEYIGKFNANTSGNCSISIPIGKNYNISFNKFGYLFQSINVIIPDSAGYRKDLKDIVLQKMEVGKKVVLNNIFFDTDQSTLRKESFSELGRAVKLMNDMQSLQIEISGYTDNVGSASHNKDLSEQRAKAVMDYLISKGCDKNRLKYKGYGSAHAIATNNTEAGRQLNRRTEFKVLKVDLTSEEEIEGNRVKNNPEITNQNSKTPDSMGAIPENLQKYDTNHDNTISYDEIVGAIDAFFEEHPQGNGTNKKDDPVFLLLDYYFGK